MKTILILLYMVVLQIIGFSQANFIQSIDFDSQQRTVFGLTGPYDYSYAERYKDGNLESWNLTQLFNLNFLHISTAVDQLDNIWAYMQDKLYKYDGNSWSEYSIPSPPTAYEKFSDISIHNNYLWLTTWSGGIYQDIGTHKLNLSDMSWQMFNSTNSSFPPFVLVGRISHTGDSTWIGTNKGMVLIYNDVVSVVLDTATSTLPSQAFYHYYVDSNQNRWLGTMNYGLVKWINDSTFQIFNTSNSELPDNFVNAIDEDSFGNLWLATDGGFACLKNDTIISYANLVNDHGIVTLAVDEQDKVWLGVSGTGELLVFKDSNLVSITSIEDEAGSPLSFVLYQNYPNPFNPSTKIKFTIPVTLSGVEGSLVSLKVYDILGSEVAILVNEELSPGEYEVEFSSESSIKRSASGVYFYQLQAGQFVQTKKMVLMK